MNIIETKISKTSKRISIFLKIGSFIMLILAALAVVAIGFIAFSNSEVKTSFLAEFNLITKSGITLEVVPEHLFVMFILMMLYSVFMFFVLYIAHSIFRDVSIENTPFNHKHVVRIKIIAIMIIVISIIGSFSNGLFYLFSASSLECRADVGGIILGIIVYCLALFFDYGCELQRQSDETL